MKIDHIAIWAEDIEELRKFYMQYFNMSCSDKYVNSRKNFSSYFLSFADGGARIEIQFVSSWPDSSKNSMTLSFKYNKGDGG